MPSNIILIEHICDLPSGALTMIQVDNDSDAIYYANGRQSFLYRSRIIDACYLFVPVMQ